MSQKKKRLQKRSRLKEAKKLDNQAVCNSPILDVKNIKDIVRPIDKTDD